jgi:hypothetical protein
MSCVTVFGNATVDLLQRVAAFPRPGETVLSEGTERCAGGKGFPELKNSQGQRQPLSVAL